MCVFVSQRNIKKQGCGFFENFVPPYIFFEFCWNAFDTKKILYLAPNFSWDQTFLSRFLSFFGVFSKQYIAFFKDQNCMFPKLQIYVFDIHPNCIKLNCFVCPRLCMCMCVCVFNPRVKQRAPPFWGKKFLTALEVVPKQPNGGEGRWQRWFQQLGAPATLLGVLVYFSSIQKVFG